MVFAVAGAGLGGCADFNRVTGLTSTPLDTTSPLAAQVREATRANYPAPSFRTIPAKPTDVRPARAYKAEVAADNRARDRLADWVAANPAMVQADPTATEAFAESQRARIPAGEAVPPVPVGSEDYAARLRALATPPPPPK